MKKMLMIGGGVFAALILAVVIFLFTGLGHAIKVVVEHVGSAATGTDVTLAGADVSLTSGEGRLTGLKVGNPKGFSTPTAFEMGDISVKIDTSTVTSDLVVIREIVIDGPHVTYEVGTTGGTNIGAIQSHCEAFGGGSKADAESPKEGGGRKFVINDLIVKNGKVAVAASLLGKQGASVALPEIHLRDIGKDGAGATAAQVANQLLCALANASLEAASKAGLDRLKEGAVDKLGGKVGGALKGVLGK